MDHATCLFTSCLMLGKVVRLFRLCYLEEACVSTAKLTYIEGMC